MRRRPHARSRGWRWHGVRCRAKRQPWSAKERWGASRSYRACCFRRLYNRCLSEGSGCRDWCFRERRGYSSRSWPSLRPDDWENTMWECGWQHLCAAFLWDGIWHRISHWNRFRISISSCSWPSQRFLRLSAAKAGCIYRLCPCSRCSRPDGCIPYQVCRSLCPSKRHRWCFRRNRYCIRRHAPTRGMCTRRRLQYCCRKVPCTYRCRLRRHWSYKHCRPECSSSRSRNRSMDYTFRRDSGRRHWYRS